MRQAKVLQEVNWLSLDGLTHVMLLPSLTISPYGALAAYKGSNTRSSSSWKLFEVPFDALNQDSFGYVRCRSWFMPWAGNPA